MGGQPTTTKTPLRIVVETFLILPERVFYADQVVQAAPVSRRAVRGYLRRLCTEGVLVVVDDTSNAYRAGRRFRRWLQTMPRTRAGGGGNSRAYLEAKALRDAQARQESAKLRALQLRQRIYGDDIPV